MVGELGTPAVLAVETFGDLAFSDIFLHLLTGNLALLADEFALEDFCSSLFDGFLLTASPRYPSSRSIPTAAGPEGSGHRVQLGAGRPCSHLPPAVASSRKENVQRHVLRLLIHLHQRVAPSKLEALQKALEPTGQVGTLPRWHPQGAAWAGPPLWMCAPSVHAPSCPGPAPEPRASPHQSGEAVKELYSQLGEKLEQLDHRKPSPAQAAETPALELPLPAVPAPAVL